MIMSRDTFTQNFLFGAPGHKKRRASVWGCKQAEEPPSSTHSVQGSPDWSSPRAARGDNESPSGSSRDRVQTYRTSVRFRQCGPSRPEQATPGLPPSQPPSRTMHPFSALITTVKQCPWMLGSDMDPFAPDHKPDFYPLVPRSLKHDTAVSFVVTDQTRPEQPQFIISCSLEHVDLVQDMLAPAGSLRMLSARGSSGRPRDGGELRSMLLDGTPNIELALQASITNSTSANANGSVSAGDNPQGGQPAGRETADASHRHSSPRGQSSGPFGAGQHGGGGPWFQAGGVPPGFTIPFVPSLPVAHGWYAEPRGNGQAPRTEQAAPVFVDS